jgi:hypothetical protein
MYISFQRLKIMKKSSHCRNSRFFLIFLLVDRRVQIRIGKNIFGSGWVKNVGSGSGKLARSVKKFYYFDQYLQKRTFYLSRWLKWKLPKCLVNYGRSFSFTFLHTFKNQVKASLS